MDNLFYMVFVFIVGLLLGYLFFGGLWLTVKKAMDSKKPALWFFGSLILRVGVAMLGFYYVSLGDWKNLLICLIGFVLARFMVIGFTKTKDEKGMEIKKDN
jgi:F1F0 ATPase subunit 2